MATSTRYTSIRFDADATTISVTMDGLTAVAVEHLRNHGYGAGLTQIAVAAVEHTYSRLAEDALVPGEQEEPDAMLDEMAQVFGMTRGAVLKFSIAALWAYDKF